MPMPKKGSKGCVGKTIALMKHEGRPTKQAQATGMSHCGKSNKPAKSGKK